jgi:O-antigen/teichoic acid export membrane protein
VGSARRNDPGRAGRPLTPTDVAFSGIAGRSRDRLRNSRVLRQTSIFAGASVGVSALAAVSSAVLARGLSTSQFGSYSLATSLLTFSALFFEFGFFVPASRLAARSEGQSAREVVGASFLVCLPVALAFAGTVFAASFFVDDWFHVQAGHALRTLAPLFVVYPLTALSLQLAQGVGRLEISSAGSVLAQTLNIVLLVLTVLTRGDLTVLSALLARTLSYGISIAVMLLWFRPSIERARAHARTIVAETRNYGFDIYIGRVLSTGTYNMDVMMLGIWSDARHVGFYSLAGALAYTVGLPATGLAAALFPRMTRERKLETRWVLAAAALGALGVAAMWVAAEPVIRIVFGERYVEAKNLAVVLALAQAVRGVTAMYNSFLSAAALGTAMRNAAFVLTGSNIVFNFALIPPYGAIGAAWASVLALVANYFARIYYYRRESRAPAVAE